jgi:hypothetical protein
MVQEYRLMEGSNGQSRGKVNKSRKKKERSNTWRNKSIPWKKGHSYQQNDAGHGVIGKQDKEIGGYS